MVGSVPTPPLRRQAVIRVDLTSRLPNPYAYRQDRNGTTGGHLEAGCIRAGIDPIRHIEHRRALLQTRGQEFGHLFDNGLGEKRFLQIGGLRIDPV